MGKPEDFQGMSQYQGRQTDAAVQVLDCIAFQKFRYSGENRPGKKQQDKPFLRLALYNLSGREAKVQVVCVDAERPDVLHPNGLVGMDCLDGVYTKTYHVSKTPQVVSLPYLRIERTKTRDTKTKREGKGAVSTLQNVLTSRTLLLPSPYRERCLQQVRAKPDTTRVRLGVIVTVGTSPLPPLFISTHVIQNASEKTQLSLLKLSARAVCCQHGGHLDIFTADNGPPITEGRCRVWVSVGDWASAHHHPSQHHILYNRVVTCPVPPYARGTARPVEASLHLSCTQSDQTIACPFIYGLCSGQCADTNIGQQPLTPTTRKRPHHSHLQGILSGNVKLRMKDTVGGEQTAVVTGQRGSLQQSGQPLQPARDVTTGSEVFGDSGWPCDDVTAQNAARTDSGQQAVEMTFGTRVTTDDLDLTDHDLEHLTLLSGRPLAVPVPLSPPSPSPQPPLWSCLWPWSHYSRLLSPAPPSTPPLSRRPLRGCAPGSTDTAPPPSTHHPRSFVSSQPLTTRPQAPRLLSARKTADKVSGPARRQWR